VQSLRIAIRDAVQSRMHRTRGRLRVRIDRCHHRAETRDARYGKPQILRCDNGNEFTSTEFDRWTHWNKITIEFSRPGKPSDNAYVESFNGRVRQELLNPSWFDTIERLDAKQEPGDGTTTKFAHTPIARQQIAKRVRSGARTRPREC
jgi:transposase InsO family protein